MGHVLGQAPLLRPGRAGAPKGMSPAELPAGSWVGVGDAHFSEAGPGRGLPWPVPVPLCLPKRYTQLSASEILIRPGPEAVLVGAVPHLRGGPEMTPKQQCMCVCGHGGACPIFATDSKSFQGPESTLEGCRDCPRPQGPLGSPG